MEVQVKLSGRRALLSYECDEILVIGDKVVVVSGRHMGQYGMVAAIKRGAFTGALEKVRIKDPIPDDLKTLNRGEATVIFLANLEKELGNRPAFTSTVARSIAERMPLDDLKRYARADDIQLLDDVVPAFCQPSREAIEEELMHERHIFNM